MNALRNLILLLLVLGSRPFAPSAFSVPSLLEPIGGEVCIVRDEGGQWGGASAGMTHQNSSGYQAKKILDVSALSGAEWAAVREVRLSACFWVRDYSAAALGQANGLDEGFEVVINGKVHAYATSGGFPVYAEGKGAGPAWHDFALPKGEFQHGRNEVVFRKAPTSKGKADDYLYLGIDNGESRGNSLVSLDGGKTWKGEQLNSIGGKGEYMVRLALLSGEREFESAWKTGAEPGLRDPAGVILYAGTRGGETRLEWEPGRLDMSEPLTAVVETGDGRKFSLRWLDAGGKPMPPVPGTGPRLETALSGTGASGLVVEGPPASVTLRGKRGYRAVETPVDLCPAMSPAPGKEVARGPACRVEREMADLESGSLRCRFRAAGGRLKLVSLFHELAQVESVRDAAEVDLFRVELDGELFRGSRDFECRSLRAEGPAGFVAELELPGRGLAAVWRASIAREGVRLGLELANRGPAGVDFKLAFPHLAGLALSGNGAADYCFYPRGGGIIADRPALIRQGYGDHQALYQVMDLFSPGLGAGWSLRALDEDGRYKILALQKHLPGRAPELTLAPLCPTKPEFQFNRSFEGVTGCSLAIEYLRRTRGPGGSFAPAPVLLSAHAGNWKTAMREYAEWAHRVWRFRPGPSRLDGVATMVAAGWGRDLLFRDGKYRSDFLKPGRDCVELMSWWEWSELGPWSTPFDQLEAKIGAAAAKRWQGYFVKDPVTGRTMWNNQPGDYEGYNERFGGLAAFRKAVEEYKKSGTLITLYTDPFRLDESSRTGRERGRDWTVVLPSGEPPRSYEVWNPCHDLPEVREWVAGCMGRVMRETGADGIRLDEYGHRGWGCYHPEHRHTYAEPGCTEWMRATAEATRLIRAAVDEVNPRAVLTTEHPGYDFLMQFLDGCITYDLTVQASPLRPLECNTQRFYFPECKAYELDHRGADPDYHKRFWNLVAAFGRELPPAMYAIYQEHADVLASRDCEPLVPTLQPRVYANRFRAGEKTFWTLYNATGHTVEGPVLEVELGPGQRLAELLSGEELARNVTGKQRVRLYLPREGVACVARFGAGR